MNFKTFPTLLVSAALLTVFAACNKVEDIKPQYQRGGNSLATDDFGNLVIAGYTTTPSKGYDAALLLSNPLNGDTLWSKSFGSSYSDAFYSVKKSNEGGFIATGFTNKASAGSPSMFVVITEADGSLVKSIKYGGSQFSEGFCVLPHENADSGYLVAGYIQKSTNADRDLYLVRINNAGELLWENSIGAKSIDPYDTVNDAAYSIVHAPDGGYFVTGSLNGYNSCCGKIFLMKVSSTGDSLWTKTFNSGIGFSLALTSDGGVAIGGSLQESSNQEIVIIKTDTAGTLLWEKVYNGSGFEYGATMIATADGGFAITGVTDSKGAGYQDAYLIKTNSVGEMQWDNTYGGSDIDQGFGLIQMNDGGFCITGLSNSGGSYIFLNRTSTDGTQLWDKYIQ